MGVGEFKAKFSDVIAEMLQGREVGITYGKNKREIGKIVPALKYKRKATRKLGAWEGKATVKFAKNFKMTIDEFLNLKT